MGGRIDFRAFCPIHYSVSHPSAYPPFASPHSASPPPLLYLSPPYAQNGNCEWNMARLNIRLNRTWLQYLRL
jgi:hypothetical protein